MNNNFLPFLKVSGTNYEIGYKIGKQFKNLIKMAFEKSIIFKELINRDKEEPEWFNKLLNHANKSYPHYIEEISGIAEGSGLKFRKVAIANFRHSFPPMPQYACSTLIFNNDGKIILAHNEDHEYIFKETSYLLKVELENGATIICHISGKIRKHFINILPGDIVDLVISPYDLTKGRITYRTKGN